MQCDAVGYKNGMLLAMEMECCSSPYLIDIGMWVTSIHPLFLVNWFGWVGIDPTCYCVTYYRLLQLASNSELHETFGHIMILFIFSFK